VVANDGPGVTVQFALAVEMVRGTGKLTSTHGLTGSFVF
jgi:hypothetical protein